MEHKTVNLDGVNVHYVEAGEGPHLVLVHGLGASHVTWYENIQPLADAGFHVLAPDLPGHGDSDKPKSINYDPPAGANLLDSFLKAIDVRRAALVGNSAGGLVSALYALDHPHRVDRLILVAAGGLGREMTWFLRLCSLPVLGEIVYQPWLQSMGQLNRKMLFHRPPDSADEVFSELDRVRSLPGSRQATLRSIRSSINYWGLREQRFILDRLSQLTMPVLTVWGENDLILPVEHASSVREALPSSLVKIIPECGHWPHMEKADEFNQLLTLFMEGSLDQEPHSVS